MLNAHKCCTQIALGHINNLPYKLNLHIFGSLQLINKLTKYRIQITINILPDKFLYDISILYL